MCFSLSCNMKPPRPKKSTSKERMTSPLVFSNFPLIATPDGGALQYKWEACCDTHDRFCRQQASRSKYVAAGGLGVTRGALRQGRRGRERRLGTRKSRNFLGKSFSRALRVMDIAPKIVDVRTEKCVFSCGPGGGRNFLTPGHQGVRVRNVHRKFGHVVFPSLNGGSTRVASTSLEGGVAIAVSQPTRIYPTLCPAALGRLKPGISSGYVLIDRSANHVFWPFSQGSSATNGRITE